MLTTTIPALLALSLPQEPPSSVELLPIQHLCPTSARERQLVPYTSMLSDDFSKTSNLLAHQEPAGISDSVLADILTEALTDEAENGELFLEVLPGQLLVTGSADQVARVKNLLAQASKTIAQTVEFELAIWENTQATAPASILDHRGYAEFTANRTPIWRCINTARVGQVTSLEHLDRVRYLRGIATEVAQKAALLAPVTDSYSVGGTAAVKAFSLIGTDDLAVHMQFAIANERNQPAALHTGIKSAPPIELPELDSFFGTCSGRIANGGALATTMRGARIGGGQITVTLRVNSRLNYQDPATPEEAAAATNLRIYPVGALTTKSLSSDTPIPSTPDAWRRGREGKPNAPYSQVDFGTLLNLLENAIEAKWPDNSPQLYECRGFLAVDLKDAPPECDALIRATLTGIQQRLTKNVHVEHRANVQPVGNQALPLADATLYALTLPTLLGREVSAYRVRETNIIHQIRMEIASDSTSLVPDTALLQSGTWFRANITPVGDNVHCDLDAFSAMTPMPAERRVMQGALLMTPRAATARQLHDSVALWGRPIAHGNGPEITVDGEVLRSSITTTISQ